MFALLRDMLLICFVDIFRSHKGCLWGLRGVLPCLFWVILLYAPELVFAAGAEGGAVTLSPYRAVYEISLGSRDDNGAQPASLTSLTGRLVHEFKGSACEGYSTSQRLVTSSQLAEGPAIVEDVRLAGFEEGSGRNYQFVRQALWGQRQKQSARGVAKVDKGQTWLHMREPLQQDVDFPHEVLFPSGWIRAIITAAQAGERIFSGYFFDGSDKVGAYFQTTVTIGIKQRGKQEEKALSALAAIPYWPISVAFFSTEEQGESISPVYEVSTILYANGVNGSLYYNFGSYGVDIRLKDLALLPRVACQ